MRVLLPFLALYRRHTFLILLGIVLAIVTLLASIGLLALSGWFLAASSLAGLAGSYTFNYMLPAAGVRGAAIFRTAGRYAERVVSHDATFRVLSHLRVFTFRKILPLSPGVLPASDRLSFSTAWLPTSIRSITSTYALFRRWSALRW